jgi:hypothetical protein
VSYEVEVEADAEGDPRRLAQVEPEAVKAALALAKGLGTTRASAVR